MKRFTKLFVLSLAVASLGLVGTVTVHAQQEAAKMTTNNSHSLVGGLWGSSKESSDKVVVLHFNDEGRMVLAFIKKATKEVDSKQPGRYTYENGELTITLDSGEVMRFTVTFIDSDTMTLALRDGTKLHWVRVKA